MATKARSFSDFLSKINWEKLIGMVEKLLANCDKTGVPPAQQERQLRNPDRKFRRHAERVAERTYLGTRAEFKKNKPAIMQAVFDRSKNASKSEVKVLRARAKLHIDLPSDDEFEDGGEE